MKLKKILSMALAVLMVMMVATAALPTTVFAADGNAFRVSKTTTGETNVEYATIGDALTNVEAGGTIYLLSDYSTTSFTIGKSVTIDGSLGATDGKQGYTIKVTDGNYCALNGNSTIILKDIRFDMLNGFNMNGTNVTFDNAYVYVNRRPFAKSNGTGFVNTMTIKDSLIENYAPTNDGQATILYEGNNTGIISLINSTVAAIGKVGSANQNNSVVCFAGQGNMTLNVDKTSTLLTSHVELHDAGYATSKTAALVWQTVEPINGAVATVNLAAGATLKINSKVLTKDQRFIEKNGKSMTINDNGAKYVVGTDVAAGTSVSFPNVEGMKFVCGSTAVAAGGSFAKPAGQTTEMIFTMAEASAITSDAEAVANGMYFRVGAAANKVYKGGFAEAVDAAAEGDTIYMLGNATLTYKTITKKNLTLDGQGFTLNVTDGYGIDIRATGFKVNNVTIVFAAQGFTLSPQAADTEFVFTIEDATITSGHGVALNYCHNKGYTLANAIPAKLVMKNSSLKCISASSEDVILLNNKAKFDVEITGSTLSVYTEKGTTTWGRVICVSGNSSGANIAITNSTLSTSYNKKAEIIDAQKDTTITITNSTMEINSTANTDADPEFIKSSNPYTLIDNGITYKVSASALAKNVKFPTKLAEGETLLGYSTSVGLVGTTYTNEAATEAMSFTALTFNSADFANVDGAGIRTDAPIGIRFTANVSKELYDALVAADANVEFGMVIAPTRLAFGQNFFDTLFTDGSDVAADKYANVANVKLTDVTVDDVAMKQFRAAIFVTGNENLTNVTDTVLTTKMSACAYFTVHYADGTTATIWADYSAANNSRSICDVAMAYVADGNERKGIIDSILTICGK